MIFIPIYIRLNILKRKSNDHIYDIRFFQDFSLFLSNRNHGDQTSLHGNSVRTSSYNYNLLLYHLEYCSCCYFALFMNFVVVNGKQNSSVLFIIVFKRSGYRHMMHCLISLYRRILKTQY